LFRVCSDRNGSIFGNGWVDIFGKMAIVRIVVRSRMANHAVLFFGTRQWIWVDKMVANVP